MIEEINWDIRKYDFKSENLTFNPTELIELDPAVYKSDMIMELDNIIVITEFQSTVVKKIRWKKIQIIYSNCWLCKAKQQANTFNSIQHSWKNKN